MLRLNEFKDVEDSRWTTRGSEGDVDDPIIKNIPRMTLRISCDTIPTIEAPRKLKRILYTQMWLLSSCLIHV
jgi:hypothetical protein